MATSSLPLSEIVDVVVTVAPISPATPTFNQGLIVGPTAVIPSVGANSRIRQYASLAQMLSDGFITSSPEYIAASIYFGQNPAPVFLWVGRQDLTSLATLIPHSGSAGTGFAVGDIVLINHGGASGGYAHVDAVTAGAVTALSVATINGVLADGTNYVVSTSNTTTPQSPSGGSGLLVDIITIGESVLVALEICRAVNSQWYACYSTAAVTADHEAIATWIQGVSPSSFYFFDTDDAAVPAGTAGNVFAFLKAANYNRVMGIYSTNQGGASPNNIYAGSALMGTMMGLNTGLANSNFTMAEKQLTGITPEPLTQTQVNIIAGNPGTGTGNNGNVYINFGNAYNFLIQGVVPSGQFADEILNLDMLASDLQFSVLAIIAGNPSVPQTDPGQTFFLHAVNGAAERARIRGYIGAGVWQGITILNLTAGTNLPSGYLAQSPPYSTISNASKNLRNSAPIYLAINEAGAAQSVLIGVTVQR